MYNPHSPTDRELVGIVRLLEEEQEGSVSESDVVKHASRELDVSPDSVRTKLRDCKQRGVLLEE